MSRKPGGVIVISEPGKKLVEIDTITCCHCQRVVPLNKPDGTKLPPPSFCLQCMRPTCPACGADGRCRPFEKAVQEAENREVQRRRIG